MSEQKRIEVLYGNFFVMDENSEAQKVSVTHQVGDKSQD